MATETPWIDDVLDAPADIEPWQLLRARLLACQEIVGPPYLRADAEALKHQRVHKRITLLAAVCGAVAVLLAILQLSGLVAGDWPMWAEAVAALVCLVAVITGAWAARHSRWILERHKAESCRLLKFGFVIDPAVWLDESANPTKRLREASDVNARLTDAEFDKWNSDEEVPDMPSLPAGSTFPPAILEQLVAYYQKRRLGSQLDFFSRRERRDTPWDRWTRQTASILFFASVMIALVHFVAQVILKWLGKEQSENALAVNVYLVILAAALPVLSASIRTVRNAFEFGRNSIRYRAKIASLRRLNERLQKEKDPDTIFRDLWCCEQVLESEHREWVRLMREAEWF